MLPFVGLLSHFSRARPLKVNFSLFKIPNYPMGWHIFVKLTPTCLLGPKLGQATCVGPNLGEKFDPTGIHDIALITSLPIAGLSMFHYKIRLPSPF
jgi:hypothetical protein